MGWSSLSMSPMVQPRDLQTHCHHCPSICLHVFVGVFYGAGLVKP